MFGPGGARGLSRSTGLDLGFNFVVLTPPETSRVSRYGNFTETFKFLLLTICILPTNPGSYYIISYIYIYIYIYMAVSRFLS